MNEAMGQKLAFRSIPSIAGVPDAQIRALERLLRLSRLQQTFRTANRDDSSGLRPDSACIPINESA